MFRFPIKLNQDLDEISSFKNQLIQNTFVVFTSEISDDFMDRFADLLLKNHEHVVYPKYQKGKFEKFGIFQSNFNSDLEMFKIVVDAGLTKKFIEHLKIRDFSLQLKSEAKIDSLLEQMPKCDRHLFYMYLLEFLDKQILENHLTTENFLFFNLFDACLPGLLVRKFLNIIKHFQHFKCIVKSYNLVTCLLANDNNVFDVEKKKGFFLVTKFDKTEYRQMYLNSFEKVGHLVSEIF